MDAELYLKEKARMCKTEKPCNCGLWKIESSCSTCDDANYVDPAEAVRIVEEWSKEHPIQTNAMKFAEVFGHDIWCNTNFDKDRRAFAIDADKFGRVQQSEWLDAPYEPPKGE